MQSPPVGRCPGLWHTRLGGFCTRFHAEFEETGGALYTAAFVMMNKKRDENLSAGVKKVIGNNSGVANSGWPGKTQQGSDPLGRKAATDRGNTVLTLAGTQAQQCKRKAALVDVQWITELDQRGLRGHQLRDTARTLIAKYGESVKG